MLDDIPYMNKVGFEGAFRLHILNEVHGPYSRAFLKKIGLVPGISVLDIGCGTGTMSCWIAKQVGPNGRVYAVDSSFEQIQIAKKNSQLKGIKNIHFIESSVYDLGKSNIQVDIIYSRYFLLHLINVERALNVMRGKLYPGGVIACEEPTISTGFCYPYSEAYKNSRQLMIQLSQIMGLDFEIGIKIKEKLMNSGFSEVDINLVQPILKNVYEKKLMGLMVKENTENYLKHSLSSEEKICSLINALNEISENDTFLIGFPRTTQAYAKK